MKEIWKQIPEYEGWYSVSNFGRVRRNLSEKGVCIFGRILKVKRILKERDDGHGYLKVVLYKYGKRKQKRIASLVMETFVGKRPEKHQINHKDGTKNNNYLSNLEYTAASQNVIHAWKNGLNTPSCGERNGNSKLTNKNIIEIIKNYTTKKDSQMKMAKKFKVSHHTIWGIVHRRSWKNFNYKKEKIL